MPYTGGKYPCLACEKWVCEPGQANCEDCEFGHPAKKCPKRIDVSTYAERAWIHGDCMNNDEMDKYDCRWPGHNDLPNETQAQLGCCKLKETEDVKLGDINKECTCGGHSEYCGAKEAKPLLIILDGDFYMELKNAVNANGAEKLKQ